MWCSIDGMSKNRPELKFFSTASNTQNDPPTVENVAVTVKKHYTAEKSCNSFFEHTVPDLFNEYYYIYTIYTVLCCAHFARKIQRGKVVVGRVSPVPPDIPH